MTAIPDDVRSIIANAFAANAAARERKYDAMVLMLTERERKIFRDAAIAGFVQGTRFANLPQDVEFPKDSFVLTQTLSCIDSFPDIYPTVSGYLPDEDEEDK
jgi:hypothetical protein